MRTDLATAYGQDRLPRYTSYPTAPHFSQAIADTDYRAWLAALPADRPASLYLHVPFCRAMCWYCGCHTTLTRHDNPIDAYAAALRSEAQLVADTIGRRLPVAHIAFGGGTPTIMSPEAFAEVMGALRRLYAVQPDAEIAIEIDPRTLTEAMTGTLGRCGVNRASLGVQSFDADVQRAINRVQSFDQTERAVRDLRRAGIAKINLDLLYGLPLQTTASCRDTVARCLALQPDRLSVFGYAHVPSFKKHQRKIAEHDLPDSIARYEQAETIAAALTEAGYVRIGLDHFAQPDDKLAIAARRGRLHRNFQGYTDDGAATLIGLGASAIGRMPQGFVQNAVTIRDYLARITAGGLATAKGYALTGDDRFRAELIERIMCDCSVDLPAVSRRHDRDPAAAIVDPARIDRLIADGAVTLRDNRIAVCGGAEFLLRSVAAAFDAHLARAAAVHSRAV